MDVVQNTPRYCKSGGRAYGGIVVSRITFRNVRKGGQMLSQIDRPLFQ